MKEFKIGDNVIYNYHITDIDSKYFVIGKVYTITDIDQDIVHLDYIDYHTLSKQLSKAEPVQLTSVEHNYPQAFAVTKVVSVELQIDKDTKIEISKSQAEQLYKKLGSILEC